MGSGVGACGEPRILHLLAEPARLIGEARHAVNDVDDEMEAVEIVEHHHVERRGRGAFLLVAADVEVGVVGSSVGEPMDQPGVSVVRKDDRLVGGEDGVERLMRQSMRVLMLVAGGA